MILTGNLGEVMKESATTAMSFIKAHADELGVDTEKLEKSDVHVHIPEGAIPKDGPSAGVTMLTALASVFTGKPVRPYLAMTGEITLRGKVLTRRWHQGKNPGGQTGRHEGNHPVQGKPSACGGY